MPYTVKTASNATDQERDRVSSGGSLYEDPLAGHENQDPVGTQQVKPSGTGGGGGGGGNGGGGDGEKEVSPDDNKEDAPNDIKEVEPKEEKEKEETPDDTKEEENSASPVSPPGSPSGGGGDEKPKSGVKIQGKTNKPFTVAAATANSPEAPTEAKLAAFIYGGPMASMVVDQGVKEKVMAEKTKAAEAIMKEHDVVNKNIQALERQALESALGQAMKRLDSDAKSFRAKAEASGDAASVRLYDSYMAMIDKTKETHDAAQSALDTAKENASKQAESASKRAKEKTRTVFHDAAKVIGDEQVTWGGSLSSTAASLASSVLQMATLYTAQAEEAGSAREDLSKSAAGTKGAPKMNLTDALDEAQMLRESEEYHRYAPVFSQYGDFAVNHLETMVTSADPTSEKIHKPTVDGMLGAQPVYDEKLTKATATVNKELVDQHGTVTDELDQVVKGIESSLQDNGEKGKILLQSKIDAVNQQIQEATAALQGRSEAATEDFKASLMEKLKKLGETRASLKDVPNAAMAMHQLKELEKLTQARIDEVSKMLPKEVTEAKKEIEVEAEWRVNELYEHTVNKAGDIEESLTKNLGDLLISAQKTGEGMEGVVNQLDQSYAGIEGQIQTNISGAIGEAQSIDAESAGDWVSKLQDYKGTVTTEFESLYNQKMVPAAEKAGKDARKGKAKKLSDKRKNIYSGIDYTWGTDENKIIENSLGLSPADGGYIQVEYASKVGSSLMKDLEGELDYLDNDNWLKSAKAGLNGDPAGASMYGQLYASTNWTTSVFGADKDLINKTFSELSDDQRTELLEDPRFPAVHSVVSEAYNDYGLFNTIDDIDRNILDAWTNTEFNKDEAEMVTDVYTIQKEASSDWYNPFSWNSDESKVLAIERKWSSKDAKGFEKRFKNLTGMTLDDVNSDIFQRDSEKGQLAASNEFVDGNTGAGRAHLLKHNMDSNDQQGLLKELKTKDLNSENYLDNVKANKEHQSMIDTYNTKHGGKEGLEQHVVNAMNKDGRSLWKQGMGGLSSGDTYRQQLKGEHGAELALDYLHGNDGRPEVRLANAIMGGRADGKEAKEALDALAKELKGLEDKKREKRWENLKQWFKTEYNGLDIEVELGLKQKKPPAHSMILLMALSPGIGMIGVMAENAALDAEDAHNANIAYMKIVGGDDDINTLYNVAKADYNFYRGGMENAAGNGVTAAWGLEAGGLVDEKWAELKKIYSSADWYDKKTGKIETDPNTKKPTDAAKKKLDRFNELCADLREFAEIHNSQKSAIADGIATAIVAIGAVVAAPFSGGTSLLIIAAAGAAAITVKALIKGKSYGNKELTKDIQSLIVDIITLKAGQVLSQWKYLKHLKDTPGVKDKFYNKVFAALLESVPDQAAALASPAVWDSPDWHEKLAAVFVTNSLKTIGGTGTDQMFGDLEGAVTNKYNDLFVKASKNLTNEIKDTTIDKGVQGKGIERGDVIGMATNTLKNTAMDKAKESRTAAVAGKYDAEGKLRPKDQVTDEFKTTDDYKANKKLYEMRDDGNEYQQNQVKSYAESKNKQKTTTTKDKTLPVEVQEEAKVVAQHDDDADNGNDITLKKGTGTEDEEIVEPKVEPKKEPVEQVNTAPVDDQKVKNNLGKIKDTNPKGDPKPDERQKFLDSSLEDIKAGGNKQLAEDLIKISDLDERVRVTTAIVDILEEHDLSPQNGQHASYSDGELTISGDGWSSTWNVETGQGENNQTGETFKSFDEFYDDQYDELMDSYH